MLLKRLKLSAGLLFGLGLTVLQAQTSINATGGNASGSGGFVSYSVGQVFYQTHSNTNGSIVAGVQQLYEISTVTAIEETTGISLFVSAYPNPTTDYLTLTVKDYEFSNLIFQLFDMKGNLLHSEKITGCNTSIAMGNFLPDMYFVELIKKNRDIKSFKIIKK